LIVFDASALVGAALKVDSVPERALLLAEEVDVFALSAAVDLEIANVLARPKFERAIRAERRVRIMAILRGAAVWFEPTMRIADCRDPKDDKYLELALAAGVVSIDLISS
jgi:predicted nucleic acid-binding protein